MTFDSSAPAGQAVASRWLLPCLCTGAFLVFAQTFMVAPLIPQLAMLFHSPVDWVGLAIPAYIVPEAIATLAIGPLSDRIGRNRVILGSLGTFIVLTALTATPCGVGAFIGWRIITGTAAAGIVPISLTLIGDVIPFTRRGKAVGYLFGSIAGGTATGAAVGALLEPLIGWRALFLIVAALSVLLFAIMVIARVLPRHARTATVPPWSAVMRGYARLLQLARAQRTYGYVLLNAILQSGLFTWLGVYLHGRFGLSETGIGLMLIGYGVPGMLFGPIIGKLADRYGRSIIVPSGVVLTGVCALSLAAPLPLNGVRIAIILLSLGFDLTHPQLAAIATDLGGGRGQAVALMAFALFSGYGVGSLLFQAALTLGFSNAFIIFGIAAGIGAAFAFRLFRNERPHHVGTAV
ncbi:MAG: MFS transporter [Rhodanobacteraceae bacterium]|nr:MAG: MFS transporter [Rhodanobacteraceae bacterium]